MIQELYEVTYTDDFKGEVKRLVRKKRFTSLPVQIEELEAKVRKGEFEGVQIKHNDNPAFDVYKLRLPNPDANVGKSDGYRTYYLVATEQKMVVFMCIYYKKEYADMTDSYIDGLIDGCLLDILEDDTK